jgi:hypothetical protein
MALRNRLRRPRQGPRGHVERGWFNGERVIPFAAHKVPPLPLARIRPVVNYGDTVEYIASGGRARHVRVLHHAIPSGRDNR